MKSLALISVLLCATVYCHRDQLETFVTKTKHSITRVIPDNPDDTLTVTVGLMLKHITDYNPVTQVLELSGYFVEKWTVEKMQWKPENFDNITTFSFPCSDLPKPDIKLYNGAQQGMQVDEDTNCVVSSNGEISYIPIVSIESFCPNNNPDQDTFECRLSFGSWTHPCQEVQIAKEDGLFLSDAEFGWRWNILNYTINVKETKYSCCPKTYCNLNIDFTIQDRSRAPAGTHYGTDHQ